MKVILLQNIKGLGDKFEIRQVKDGYARNFLIPRQLAKIATEQIIKELEAQKAAWEKEEKEIKNKLEVLAKDLANQEFRFTVKTGKSGEIFGSISKDDIKKVILNQIPNDDIDVNLERPLKTLGEHKVEIVLLQGLRLSGSTALSSSTVPSSLSRDSLSLPNGSAECPQGNPESIRLRSGLSSECNRRTEQSRRIDDSTSSLDFARDDPELAEGSLTINPEQRRRIDLTRGIKTNIKVIIESA